MLQIAEIQNPAASLGGAVIPVELLHKLGKSPRAGGRLGQIYEHLCRFVREIFQFSFQSGLAAFPGCFDTVCQILIHIFLGKYQPSVINDAVFDNSVPSFLRPQSLKLVQGVPQVDGCLLHSFAGRKLNGALLDYMNLTVQIVVEVIDQKLTPNGFRSIGNVLRVQQGQAGIQPLLRVQVASGAVVDLFNDLGHQTVIPAQPLRIHKGPEIRVIFTRIGLVQ